MEYKRDLATPLAPTLGGPGDRRKKRNKKNFKPKGIKPHSRKKMKKICVGGRCGA
jgi:hypothetical protein